MLDDPRVAYPVAPARPVRSSVLPRLITVLGVLVALIILPTVAERVQYGITRGQERARMEAARAELTRLGTTAELVKLSDTSKAFRLVAQRIEPSVVHIDVVQALSVRQRAVSDEFSGLPQHGQEYLAQGQGSGFVVDAAGYVLTNYHVVQNAADLRVNLSDGRSIDDVTVVGYDVATDLALLKIGAGDLTPVTWGDSDALQVGDWVLAVGNPYGLDRTVTSGIVSAKERRGFSETPYQTFLQTDAAVNPGNSGGPLLNITGEVIGVNTAIVGNSFQGISFAIPSKTVRSVYDRLKESGKVARGWLGVGLAPVPSEKAAELGIPAGRGAVVTGVLPRSPAARAGLQEGDVILQWDGKDVRDPTELALAVAGSKIGSTVELKILRESTPRTLTVTVEERPNDVKLGR